MIKEYVTVLLASKLIKNLLIVIVILFLINQCNRGCKRDEVVTYEMFDYTSIALAIPSTDSIPVDTIAAKEDLKEITTTEMIEFAKDHSSMFVNYMSKKYHIVNGYIEKK